MDTLHLPAELISWIHRLACVLDLRSASHFQPLLIGLLFATGRRTVTSWLRAGGLSQDFRAYYSFVATLGRSSKQVAGRLLRIVLDVVDPGDRLLFALDDTTTERYGPQVEGAGIHHDPTPGPANKRFLYGHVWVTLALVVRHPLWGCIGLPLLACLYVRQCNMRWLRICYRLRFATKLEQAADLLRWLASWLSPSGRSLWVVADGAYAKRPVLKQALASGIVVVSRLRKDAALRSLPPVVRPEERRRGRPAKYGKQSISLAKRAGHAGGWQTEEFVLYGRKQTKTYKTFLATYEPAAGTIRVVLVRERDGWVAFFCTAIDATVARILEAVADRASLEQVFHDIKEIHGAGEQQVRNYWANVGAYHLTLWWHTLVELWAWNKKHAELTNRLDSPWDDVYRRPSHADRHNALRQSCLREQIRAVTERCPVRGKLRRLVGDLARLAGC